MTRVVFLLSFLLFALPACQLTEPPVWEAPMFRAHAGAFVNQLDGTVVSQTGPVTGSLNTDTAGQSDTVVSGHFGASGGVGPFQLALSGFEYSQQGDGIFTGSFAGLSFTGPVRTDFEARNLKATAELDLLQSDRARGGILLGLDYFDVDLKVTNSVGPPVTGRIDEQLPIPVLGLHGAVKLTDELWIAAEIMGLDIEVDDFDVTLLDFEGGLHYSPLTHLELFLGYRHLQIEFAGPTAANTVSDVDLDLSGPFFGVAAFF